LIAIIFLESQQTARNLNMYMSLNTGISLSSLRYHR